MKNYTIPRTMESAQWAFDADPIEHHPQSRTESAAGFALALLIGVLLAAAAVHWWAS